MSNQPRVAKVLAVLLVSMTLGALLLMILGTNPPSAGAFCLNAYYKLDPIERALKSDSPQKPSRWNCIEVYYSNTKAGNVNQLAVLNGLSSPEDINCHFVICNGLGETDGKIQTCEKWLRQWSLIPGTTWYGTDQTIRICLIADKTHMPTDLQIKRLDALVEALYRKFDIKPKSIYMPENLI